MNNFEFEVVIQFLDQAIRNEEFVFEGLTNGGHIPRERQDDLEFEEWHEAMRKSSDIIKHLQSLRDNEFRKKSFDEFRDMEWSMGLRDDMEK